MASQLLYLYSSSRAWRIKRPSAYFPTPIRGYSQSSKENSSAGHGMEKAPTTAEEFERVAEEFERVAEAKARCHQTSEKAHGVAGEAASGDSIVECVEGNHKEEPVVGKGNLHKTGD